MLFENSVSPEARPAYRKDAISGLVGGLYLGCVFPFIAFVARDRLHASVALLSVISAAPFVGNVFAIFWARAMCGRPKMPFALRSWLLARTCILCTAFTTTPLTFAAAIFGAQFIGTISGPAYAAMMKAIYPDDQRGRIMAYCRVGLAFATVAATFAAGEVLHKWHNSYRVIFPVGAAFGIAAALVFSRIKIPRDGEDDQSQASPLPVFLRDTLGLLRENRAYRWFAMSVFTYGIGNLLLAPIYPIYQVDVLHISATQIAILSNLSQGVWMISFLYWGPYVDRHTPLKGALINIFLTGIIPLTYIFARDAWSLWPAFVVAGVINAGIEMSYFNSILHLAEPDRIAQYQGLHSFLLGVRGSIAPFIGAAMKDAGMELWAIFTVALVLMVVGGVMQAVGLARRRVGRPAEVVQD